MDHLDIQLGSSRFQEIHFLNRQIQEVFLHQLPQGWVIQSKALLAGLFAPFSTAE